MSISWCVMSGLSVSILALNVLAQTPKPKAGALKVSTTGILMLDSDDECALTIDGTAWGNVSPDKPAKIDIAPGEHILKAVIPEAPTVIWRKVVEVKRSQQSATIISLRALHLEYIRAQNELQKANEKEAYRLWAVGTWQYAYTDTTGNAEDGSETSGKDTLVISEEDKDKPLLVKETNQYSSRYWSPQRPTKKDPSTKHFRDSRGFLFYEGTLTMKSEGRAVLLHNGVGHSPLGEIRVVQTNCDPVDSSDVEHAESEREFLRLCQEPRTHEIMQGGSNDEMVKDREVYKRVN